MCTLIVVRNGYRHYPLVVAANRDELLDRPSEPPRVWEQEPRILAPLDAQRGGTWIGVNGRGVFAAVTNRHDVLSVRGKDSRGELALIALDSACASEALERVRRLDMRRYNGFHLVIADQREAWLAYGDGERAAREEARVEPLPDGIHVISNLGAGPDHAERARNVLHMFRKARLDADAPHVSGFDRVLTFHDDERHVVGSGTKSMGSVCIHRPKEENYGTRSSAFIRLRTDWNGEPPTWLYRHRERPDDGFNCNAGWQPELLLPILS
ncbi:MAG TPA: NRDE family protein [Patescibacteria group bacterium]|nr:NRDE family protein [Patescibacteria group bacterium]